MNQKYFYTDSPIFGLDIGTSSIKVMQIGPKNVKLKKRSIIGHGAIKYDKSSVDKDGVLKQPETIAKAINELFNKNIVGAINTRRVALSVPVAKTYNKVLNLPLMPLKALPEAVKFESEQYIPASIDDLYIDYNITKKDNKGYELFVSAAPKKIIDSYLVVMELLGLETVGVETTINASSRLVSQAEHTDVPTILIDFGSKSVDITIYDQQLVVTGTVTGGGDNFTQLIAKNLDVNEQIANTIKNKYGLLVSKKQQEILKALEPILELIVKEIKKMVRYYEDRTSTGHKIDQIITMGGGANLPGLSEYLTNALRLPTRMCNPWNNLNFDKLQPPNETEKTMYITVAGLALINPKDI